MGAVNKSNNDDDHPHQQLLAITTATHAYLLIWCISWSLPLWNAFFLGDGVGGLDERPLVRLDYVVLLPLVVLLFGMLLLRRGGGGGATDDTTTILLPLALVVHLVDLVIRWHRLPHVWDHEQWAMQVELAFVAVFGLQQLFHGKQHSLATAEGFFLKTFRRQFGLFYLAATFWKLNTSFLHVPTSCGSVLILELVGTYLPPLSSATIEWVAWLARYITLVTEGLLGTWMLLASSSEVGSSSSARLYRYLSVGMGSLFHLSIFLLPVNGAGGFSMDCVRHFILFFDSHELRNRSLAPSLFGTGVWYMLGIAGLLRLRQEHIGQGFDFGFLGMCVLLCLYLHLIVMSYSEREPVKQDENNITTACKNNAREDSGISFRLASGAVLFVSLMYAFAGPVLGIQHMGAPTMYSNLRYYNRGNHLLVPTSILPEDIIYGGSLVQVVKSTCPSLNQRFAYIRSSDAFPPTPLKYMKTALSPQPVYQLFPLCMSNPHSRAVLSDLYIQSNPKGSETFASFILPISEVRKALAEASLLSESYTVAITDSPVAGDAGSAPENVVVLDSDGGCQVTTSEGDTLEDDTCANNRLARAVLLESYHEDKQPSPLLGSAWLARVTKALAAKLLTPYPQLVGWDEELCMS